MPAALDALKEHLAEIHDLRSASQVLGWDSRTYMPPAGARGRAEVMATLRRLAHARFSSDETARLLDAADRETRSLPEESDGRCLVARVRRDYERRRRLPDRFVADRTRDATISVQVWEAARPANDFAAFRPHLEKMVDYARQEADYLGYTDHPYDALLDDYEPGMTTADVQRIFDQLRLAQVALAQQIAARPRPRGDFLRRDYPEAAQAEFGLRVAADFGYDLRRGRLDVTVHPFASGFHRDDVRITSRYDRSFLPQAIFAIFHETGHALYEQNVSPTLARTPLAHGCSSAFHESQSRLWENLVGRSRAFWERYFPLLQATFPESLRDVNAEEFSRAVNCVEPTLIRVEADEVTYNLHIILRFELELELVTGELRPADLPEAWAAKMQALLGIKPPDDRDGVIQDTHWSTGSIGYFPTYALGNVLGAQIFATLRQAHPDLEAQIAAGDFTPLLRELTDRIYQHGRKFLPAELALRVNGRPLDPGPYLEYLNRKFGELYGVKIY
jgi:carboxypeptidase Taq